MRTYITRQIQVKAFQIGAEEVSDRFREMGNKGDFIVVNDNGNVEVYNEQDFHNKFVGVW